MDAASAVPIATGSPQLPPAPFAAELLPHLEAMAANPQPPLTEEALPLMRGPGQLVPGAGDPTAGRAVSAEEHVIPGPAGAPDIEITVFRPTGSTGRAGQGGRSEAQGEGDGALPILINFHGGGMIVGHRSWEHGRVVELVERHRVIGVNVEYRLAPEHPFPAGVDDNYAATRWVADHAHELGGDPQRIVVMGGSAGGAFAAAVALMARDRGGPALAGQLLLCPMLDNTNTTVSSLQYDGIGTWQRDANLLAWRCVLGADLAYSEQAPAYAAPARATDLSGLPPAFIEVGSAEMFRDEDVAYANRIWAAGGEAELHVWAGGFHGFDMYAPESELSRAALDSRDSWLRRILAATPQRRAAAQTR